MENNEYKNRIIDEKLKLYLETFGAVCIEGPKWSGKTSTSKFHSKSGIYIGDSRGNFQNRQLAKFAPYDVLIGDNPRLIDEWQEVPELWDAVRFQVDQENKKGLFILTGSSTPKYKGVLHSGAGRIGILKMRTMSLYESGDSNGKISLKELCDGKIKNSLCGEVELNDLAKLIIRGGWPGNLNTSNYELMPKSYMDALINADINIIDEVKRDSKKVKLLLQSLARNESTTASITTVQRDINDIEGVQLNVETINEYINVFDRMFLLNNQKPFATSVRSSQKIKKAEKRHFCDPSLACALLDLNEKKLIGDLETFGFMFESLVERDLQIYAESFDAKLFHYQDYDNKEIDAVIELDDGSWCGFEIKLGASQIDEAADNLLKISKSIEKNSGKAAKVLCVICGLTNCAYKREDGVFVVPITSLKN